MQKIIVIEDANIIRLRIIKLLQENGYNDVIGFASADAIAKNPHLFLDDVSLIIADIRLPGISGIELTKLLNYNPKYCNIPVFFMSASGDAKTINDAIKAGGIDYLIKPFVDQLFIDRVKRIIGEPNAKSQSKIVSDEIQIKNVISLEYERASRGKHPLSFIKLKFNIHDIENSSMEISKMIRKIDTVYVNGENVTSVLPLTDKKGLDTVFDKINTQLIKCNIKVLEKNLITFTPGSSQSADDLIKTLL